MLNVSILPYWLNKSLYSMYVGYTLSAMLLMSYFQGLWICFLRKTSHSVFVSFFWYLRLIFASHIYVVLTFNLKNFQT